MKKYSGGVFSLALGTVVAQTVNLLTQPIITRVIPPEELGSYSFVLPLANLIIPIASLKLYINSKFR